MKNSLVPRPHPPRRGWGLGTRLGEKRRDPWAITSCSLNLLCMECNLLVGMAQLRRYKSVIIDGCAAYGRRYGLLLSLGM